MMQRWTVALLVALLVSGCSGFFKIPKKEYRETVRTLGVLPLLVDENSTINHPERGEVVALLRRTAAGKEGRLIDLLQEQGSYFDVRPVDGDPRQLFSALVQGSGLRGEADERFRHYDFSGPAVGSLAQRNVVDALLVVVLNGAERTYKRWDRGHLNYLEANFNDILASAAVVLPSGEVVWEYPGGDEAFLHLQYPDFEEAYYNRTDQIRVKYITTAGLERALAEEGWRIFGKSTFSRRYEELFESIASALKPGLIIPFGTSEAAPAAGK